MNVEYIKLSDGSTAITDENGRISKRETETSSQELLVENKIETIDESITETKKDVKDYKGLVFLSKYMLIAQPVIIIAISSLGYAFDNLIGLIESLSIGVLMCGTSSIVWGIIYPMSKRKLKGFEGKLKRAEELKLEFEKELVKEKELVMQKESAPINKPISLIKQNEFEIPLINEQLDNAYFSAIHSKPKRLVLQNNTNKRR